jgi:hypothetical protein
MTQPPTSPRSPAAPARVVPAESFVIPTTAEPEARLRKGLRYIALVAAAGARTQADAARWWQDRRLAGAANAPGPTDG